MPNIPTHAHLRFLAIESGGTLNLRSSTWDHESDNFFVFDDGDGNADTATDYYLNPGFPYSGYTVEINGQNYAIYGPDSSDYFYIPYSDPSEGLASLDGTPITQTFVNSGDDAVVANICFAAGTLIATPDSETPVETLQIGDLITTTDGRAVLVKWLGRQTHTRAAVNMALPERVQPVRIRAGALGGGLPKRDLTVTADHGMVLDGLVINASALVNGETIDFVPGAELGDSLTVYHIETEAHDVILANGAASETFIDAAGRAAFDNCQEYLDLYGAERIIPEMKHPRISSPRLLPTAIRQRLGLESERSPQVLAV